MRSSQRRLNRLIPLAAMSLVLAACQSASPVASSATPGENSAAPSASSASAVNPSSWTQILPEPLPQSAGSGNSISTCVECDSSVDTTMSGVVTGPAGLVAVGWIYQGFHGLAWHSIDGKRWIPDVPLPENTLLTAVAADASRYVAVGLDGSAAAAWSSRDGVSWQKAPSTGVFDGSSLHIIAITHWSGGFAAAGYQGTESGAAEAAFWVSPDGVSWQRAPDSPGLTNAHALSIAENGRGLVAVGTSGTVNVPGPAAVWTSTDGITWSRAPSDPAFDGARMRTVAAVPGTGLVAAGEDLAGDTGVVWTSADGTHWTRAATGPDMGGPDQQVRFDAIAAGGPGIVIVGSAATGPDAQYGDGAVWISGDGISWRRQPGGVEFDAGEVTAVGAAGRGLVAVGYTGAPDDFTATVWTSPVSWSH